MNEFYSTLRNEDYKPFVESKGGGSFSADYISWAVMHDYLKKNFQYVEYKIHEYQITKDGTTLTLPYMLLPNGTAVVKVTLTLEDMNGDEHVHQECLAVRNFTMKAEASPDAAQVENTIRRCIAKAGSMLTGFGIELWFGEDIKDLDYNPEIKNQKELEANTSGEVNKVPQNRLKLVALSQAAEFKGKGVQAKIKKWIDDNNPTEDEVLAQYTALLDKQMGLKQKQKESK